MMSVFDYFKPVSSWTAEDLKSFLDRSAPGELQLIDVRQPNEYKGGHLPGAILIPLGDLPDRLNELDPAKPTLTY
ncbi:MAG: hypothetical protein GXP58_01525 [Deltaproteobacteria bacterium]|nr:hypothetical protein [Deltaproteobacteria bacterium]